MRNGAGKTILLRILASQEFPLSGSVSVLGAPPDLCLLSSGTPGAMKLHVGCATWTHAPCALTGFLRRLPREYRCCAEVRHRAFFEDPRSEQQLEETLGDVGAEWVI